MFRSISPWALLLARLAIGILILVAVLGLAGCGTNEPAANTTTAQDCDTEDIKEFDTDCGYWDQNGVFWFWFWVSANNGRAPAGWQPSYPPGGSPTRLPGVAPQGARSQPAPPGWKSTTNTRIDPKPAPARPAQPATGIRTGGGGRR